MQGSSGGTSNGSRVLRLVNGKLQSPNTGKTSDGPDSPGMKVGVTSPGEE